MDQLTYVIIVVLTIYLICSYLYTVSFLGKRIKNEVRRFVDKVGQAIQVQLQ